MFSSRSLRYCKLDVSWECRVLPSTNDWPNLSKSCLYARTLNIVCILSSIRDFLFKYFVANSLSFSKYFLVSIASNVNGLLIQCSQFSSYVKLPRVSIFSNLIFTSAFNLSTSIWNKSLSCSNFSNCANFSWTLSFS